MKRYVIELSNDVEKRATDAGQDAAAVDVMKIRNAYISGFVTEFDAVKSILNIWGI